MKCEHIFCIYQSDGECTADEIGIDETGMCDSCIYPNLEEAVLKKAKTDLLNKFDDRDNRVDLE